MYPLKIHKYINNADPMKESQKKTTSKENKNDDKIKNIDITCDDKFYKELI